MKGNEFVPQLWSTRMKVKLQVINGGPIIYNIIWELYILVKNKLVILWNVCDF